MRLNRALPEIFPAPVLTHALNRRWTPPMPRLAVDGYWRAHVVRADRLARALAARSGAPDGWTWRIGSQGPAGDVPRSRPRPIASRNSRAARASAASADSRSIASAGIATCGTPDRTAGPHGTPPASPRGGCGTRRATTTACCGGCRRGAARRPADGCGRPRRSTTACRCSRSGASGATTPWPVLLVVLGRAQPAGDQPRRARRQMRRGGEAIAGRQPQGPRRTNSAAGPTLSRYAASMPSAFM